jgi:DNA-binding LacI/PurR family transcriptional regulator
MQQLWRRDPRITGVICLNDELGVAVIDGARRLGKVVPRDLSVVGSNDLKMARFYNPAITTVRINIDALVDTGLNLLFDEINLGTPSQKPVKMLQKCELIIRESTGPAMLAGAN